MIALYLCISLCMLGIFSGSSHAASIIRDTEIERTLATYMKPLLDAAHMAPDSVRLIIVNDASLNAFVANGSNIYMHSGLLMSAQHPDVVIGVLAHELGHITGGHLIRTVDAYRQMQLEYGLFTLLSVAAAAGGAGDLSQAAMAAGGQIAQEGFLRYSRGQEQSADQAGLGYLDASAISAEGLLDMFATLRQRERLSRDEQQTYLTTHPLTSERMAHIRHHVDQVDMTRLADDHPLVIQHRRMVTKLKAFLMPLSDVRPQFATGDDAANLMGRAIVHYRASELEQAKALMQQLIASYPDDPFYHELLGQMLFEHGDVAEASEAYRRAYALISKPAPLMALHYARALIATQQSDNLRLAEQLLTNATQYEPQNRLAWRTLGQLYAESGRAVEAKLAQAETELLAARFNEAIALAKEVVDAVDPSNPVSIRAQDVIATARLKRDQQEN